jgi:hypothetical protein
MAKNTTLDLDVWEDFVSEIRNFMARNVALHAKAGVRIADPLFRGQREASWELETTLERYCPPCVSLYDYYRSIWAAKSQIEAYTGQTWKILSRRRFLQKASDSVAGLYFKARSPAYDYMAYLRHHGFPSPLLDWSRSPFVAAFFAFREPGSGERVAIFAYLETTAAVKVGGPSGAEIVVHGPYVRTHRRHFLQQCQYTTCIVFKDSFPAAAGSVQQWHYTPHEDVFSAKSSPALDGRHQLFKYTLPRSQRQRVLAYLDAHNVNAYSLFGSEETLMEAMAARELLYWGPEAQQG